MAISRSLQAAFTPWPVGVLRLVAVLLIIGQLVVTAGVQRPDLLHPSLIGSDPSNYIAAAERLNAGHSLYGPLEPGDRPVPGYPDVFPAPLLSPPLIAVILRPVAILPGELPVDLWWLGGLALLTELAAAFAFLGKPRNLIVLIAVLALGLPLALLAAVLGSHVGIDSPISSAALSGNVNAYLVGLFVLTWWASSRDRPWLAGTAAALATALKLGPVVLLWWFVTQRSWGSARAFVVAGVTLAAVGVAFAGIQAKSRLPPSRPGRRRPADCLSVPAMLERLLGMAPGIARYGTIAAVVVGLVAVMGLRQRPRAAFAAAILTTIYCSPVVLEGNFALLVALAAPWVLPRPAGPAGPAGADLGDELRGTHLAAAETLMLAGLRDSRLPEPAAVGRLPHRPGPSPRRRR